MLQWLASETRPFVQDMVFFSLFALAVIRGAGPERAIAAVWMILFEGIPRIYRGFWDAGHQLEQIDLFYALIDTATCVAFVAIALNANRNYPLIIAALQVLAVAAHLARGLIETISPIAYATMVIAPSWLQLAVLGLGLVRHIQRQRQYGPYREWRLSIPPAIDPQAQSTGARQW
ncbi:MAG: hypothetical protein AAFQ13_03585 [Pseudomonadota bacterium]